MGGDTVAGVTITLAGPSALTSITTTDAGGRYAFAGLADGAYTVTPTKTGFTSEPPNRAVAVGGADRPGQDFTATAVPPPPPTHTISGAVGGALRAGITVTLQPTGTSTATAVAVTGATGAFSLSAPAGTYLVVPSSAIPTIAFTPLAMAVTVTAADLVLPAFLSFALPVPAPPNAVSVSPVEHDGDRRGGGARRAAAPVLAPRPAPRAPASGSGRPGPRGRAHRRGRPSLRVPSPGPLRHAALRGPIHPGHRVRGSRGVRLPSAPR